MTLFTGTPDTEKLTLTKAQLGTKIANVQWEEGIEETKHELD